MRPMARPLAASALAGLVISLSACGGGSGEDGGQNASLTSDAADTATANLAPFTGQGSAFPVEDALSVRPPAGTTFAFLQCASPICALQAQLVGQATRELLGNDLVVVTAGASAQESQQAMDTIIAQRPDLVIVPGIEPSTIRPQLDQLDQLDIPVVTLGVSGTEDYPAIKSSILGGELIDLAGKLLADWAVAENGASPSVFYNTPELSFSDDMRQAYEAEMATLCPDCEVRVVDIPLSTLGNTAPTTVVNDLRAHPKTKTAIFATEDAANGLPAALKVAGIQVSINGYAPSPGVLQGIKDGDITAGFTVDPVVAAYVNVDVAARIVTGQPLSADEEAGLTSTQMLTAADLKSLDVSNGYLIYPDAAERFNQLWAGQPG